jgi:hypothetical protein
LFIEYDNIDARDDDFNDLTWPEMGASEIEVTPLVDALKRRQWTAVKLLLDGGAHIQSLAWCLSEAIDAPQPDPEVMALLFQQRPTTADIVKAATRAS